MAPDPSPTCSMLSEDGSILSDSTGAPKPIYTEVLSPESSTGLPVATAASPGDVQASLEMAMLSDTRQSRNR
jgi:hypothetical protein